MNRKNYVISTGDLVISVKVARIVRKLGREFDPDSFPTILAWMPVPSWASSSDPYCGSTSAVVLKSEVKALAQEFIDELQQFIDTMEE